MTVTGLVNGQVYLFSVAGISANFDSAQIEDDTGSVHLCKLHTSISLTLCNIMVREH